MRPKIRKIENWEELINFLENINHYKQFVYCKGWLRDLDGDKTSIKTLFMSTAPISLVRKINKTEDKNDSNIDKKQKDERTDAPEEHSNEVKK